mmetsp:Transcript_2536/g.6381  ORF Transcript_2536/g.6381 Transcript_2536/m.6381 type:complete len:1225 (+) Transcript_2536:138-3812(+)
MNVANAAANATVHAASATVNATVNVANVAMRATLKPLAMVGQALFTSGIGDFDSGMISSDDEDSTVFDVEGEGRSRGVDALTQTLMAKKETRGVNIWRALVLLSLLAAGATTSVFAYKILNDEAQEDFEYSYELFVRTIEDVGAVQIMNGLRGCASLAEQMAANALANNETFPFVTLQDFELLGGHARRLSRLDVLQYTPIVEEADVEEWANYSALNQGWIERSRELATGGDSLLINTVYEGGNINPDIWERGESGSPIRAVNQPLLPIWHISPPPYSPSIINFNMMSELFIQRMFPVVQAASSFGLSEVLDVSRLRSTVVSPDSEWDESGPHSILLVPVFDKLTGAEGRKMSGLIQGVFPWQKYLENLLPNGVEGVMIVLENSCGQAFTYILNGANATYLGEGDLHDSDWNSMKERLVNTGLGFSDFDEVHQEQAASGLVCSYWFNVYPTNQLESQYTSNLPIVVACIVAGTFFLMATTFFMYDRFVRKRNAKVVKAATQSNKIVESLFPSNVRDRLLAEEIEAEKREVEQQQGTQTRLKNYLANDGPAAGDMETDDIMYKTQPIADLFPETSILFADIAGFTAWSSAREPSQVFTLLETVYRAFDEIATRRRVFKVETVGDCYVAATGLPEPRIDHAVAMVRFAKDCMFKMQVLTRTLEVSLGPDTADLAMRMGIHSGPVTAGVLRGERSRFQLFGDTMNTASRMESTGIREHIQISQDTADLLVAAGKNSWIRPREDVVVAKGKGEMQTYFVQVGKSKGSERTGTATASMGDEADVSEVSEVSEEPLEEEVMKPTASAKIARLIDWNVDVLIRLLKTIVAHRRSKGEEKAREAFPSEEDFSRSDGTTVLDEVVEQIALPEFDQAAAKEQMSPDKVALDAATETQLYEYVAAIAAMYRDNPFHNFEHASHVTMSVSKLMSRIVAPSDLDFQSAAAKNAELHDHTYGITSDPLTQFACVLSALIHDVDHTGVPNTQLVKENTRIAAYYGGRSVAEQNSVDVAWDLLFDDHYEKLRQTIYTTKEELQRFRKLVVNSVMATDIMDKELKALRNARWDRAFAEGAMDGYLSTVNRKATIVIEHLIQASDVAHTMQHWHIYRKWNAKLFEEMYKAYVEGRAEKNPADFWYKGEIGFFDFYIIPLAKKLKECGVFGVSSKEYLNYAERNRKEWEMRGQEVVSELIENVNKIYQSQLAKVGIEVEALEAPQGLQGAIPTNITIDAGQIT